MSDSGTNPNDIDTISYANATSGVIVNLYQQGGSPSAGWAAGLIANGIESIVGSAFNDTLIGTDTPESINDTAADILIGGAGDDELYGLGGSDVLEGGPGFDVLVGGNLGQFGDSNPVDTARFNARTADLDVFYNNDGSVSVAAPGGGIDLLREMEFIQTFDGTFNIGSFNRSQANLLVGESGRANTLNDDNRNSLIFGRNGNDVLSGSGGTDRLEGDAGNDTLNGGADNDSIFGGTGTDVAVYSGSWKDYLITRSGTTYTVKDLRGGAPDGTDTLFDVENMRFSNGTFASSAALRSTPTSTTIAAKTASEGKTFSFRVATHFSDADAALGDKLTYSASGLPSWLKINAATGVLSGKPDASDISSAKKITVTATDIHGLKTSQGFSLSVDGANGAPTTLKLSSAKVAENKKAGTLVGKLSATEPDGDALTFKLASNPGGMFKIKGNQLVTNKRLDFEKLKSHKITVEASDPDGLTVSKTFNISVKNVVDVITGNSKSNKLVGAKGEDLIKGKGGNDKLSGGRGPDKLFGDDGKDKLEGGAGKDKLTGGKGADQFIFKSVKDSPNKNKGWDVITDFRHGQKDKINLKTIDAKKGTNKNDAFKFVGDDKFSGKKGELRYEKGKTTFVYGDVNGDKKADFAIALTDKIDLVKGDFAL